nr:class I SAM-dependent methyltransferase [Acidithiobacillus ferrooxidans]
MNITTEKEARQHLYSRPPLDPNGEDSLAKSARQITSGAAVLDIGCAVGELGRYLTEQKHRLVDGIEANSDAVVIARSFYRQVWEADLETASLADFLGESRHQYIICVDVLEHLRDTGQLLRQVANFLMPGGKLLVSIPNVGHMGILLGCFRGISAIAKKGCLTRPTYAFLPSTAFCASSRKTDFPGGLWATIADLQNSEFSDFQPEAINQLLLREMQGWNDSITYQFIVEAYPQE